MRTTSDRIKHSLENSITDMSLENLCTLDTFLTMFCLLDEIDQEEIHDKVISNIDSILDGLSKED